MSLADRLITVFQSDVFLLSLCFGPIVIVLAFVGIQMLGVYRLRGHHSVDEKQTERLVRWTGRVIKVAFLAPIALFMAYFLIEEMIIFPYQVERARINGGMLVQAIESFHIRTGEYPATLDELVPIEMERVPILPGGESFGYLSKDDGYRLFYGYRSVAPVYCRYDSGSLGWYCD